MPTSNVTRVRSDGFSKIKVEHAAGKRSPVTGRVSLHGRGQAKELAQLRRSPLHTGQQIVLQSQWV